MGAPMIRGPLFSSETELKKGHSGAQVERIQDYLIRYGFLPADAKREGVYGDITEAAVKEYQVASGMAGDGIIGPKTRAYMLRRRNDHRADVAGPGTPNYPAGSTITYCFGKDIPSYLSRPAVQEEFKAAFEQWEACCPLTFQHVSEGA